MSEYKQKQPGRTYRLAVHSTPLPREFPAVCVRNYQLSDHEARTTLHVHSNLELGYCHSGTGIFIVGAKVMPFNTGDAVVINSREMHRAQSRKGTVSTWTWMWLDVGPLILPFCTDSTVFDTSTLCGDTFRNVLDAQAHPLECLVIRELAEALSYKKPGRETVVRALVALLMTRLNQRVAGPQEEVPAAGDMQHRERLAPAINFISTHYPEPMQLKDLAAMCNVSVPHFRRLFAATMGENPVEYILRLRVSMACLDLKETEKTAERVAFENGFPTFSCFLRKFKEYIGTTPHRYRRNHESANAGPRSQSREEKQ